MKSFSLKPLLGRGLAVALLLGWGLSQSPRADAQYNLRNPRHSKTHVHTRFEPQPRYNVRPQPYPMDARMAGYAEDETDWGVESEWQSDDTRLRAQQALMHNGGRRPQVAAIPSAYRVQGLQRTSATEHGEPGAPMPRESAPESYQARPDPYDRSAPYDAYEAYDDGPTEYTYDEEYFEGDAWSDGGGGWQHDPFAQDYQQFGHCFDWCESVFCQGNTSVQLGVVGFKNPVNQGRDGSFGFQQAVNFGTFLPFLPESGIGWQLGVRTIQANIAGTSFADEQRNQTFFTSGFFHRRRCGLNAGFVFDMLQDNWYADINVGQVRAQFSWRLPDRHEWGYWFAAGDSVDTSVSPINPQRVDEWNPKELHAFFYRRRLCMHPCATAGLFVGFAGGGDGLIGANTFLPVNNNWAVQSSFVYLAPNESNADGGNEHEVWNVSFALVWTIGRQCEARFAPMFDVADNGSFIVERNLR